MRTERDTLGEVHVPDDALYGAQTQRAVENYPISGLREHPLFVRAFIVLKKGYMADEHLFDALKAHVKERAGRWKYPRWIAVRTELPKTATGKIQRFKLREEDAQT